MAGFPETPDGVDVGWLSQVLGVDVTYVRAENLGEGVGVMAEVTRLHVESEQDVPATLVLKTASPAEENRQVAAAYGFYEREVSFYRELSADVEVRVPRCHHAEMEAGGVPFVILMEEVTGARTVDQLDGCTLADAEAIVDTVAALHGAWWDSPRLDGLGWLPGFDNAAYRAYAEALPAIAPLVHDHPGLDDVARPWLDRLASGGYPGYLAWWSDGPQTFCHYDLRLDNILFDVDGSSGICLLDWQLSLRHRGTFDLSYFLGQNVSTEFRRDHQDALLRRYHDRLLAHGVVGYSFDRCWDDYRAGMLMHVASAPQLAALDGGNERGRQLLESMLVRGWQAAVDLDAGFVVDQL